MKNFFGAILWLLVLVSIPQFGMAKTHTPTQEQAQIQTSQHSHKVNFSPIFVALSDTMSLVEKGDTVKASTKLEEIFEVFLGLNINQEHQTLKQSVISAFKNAIESPSAATLGSLSSALYRLEQAQNPVDYTQANARFTQKIIPALTTLDEAIVVFKKDGDIDKLRLAYDGFNRVWVANERVVRNTQKSHYGAIETAMALLRVAIETQDMVGMDTQFDVLKRTIERYIKGEALAPMAVDDEVDLAYGVSLLEEAQKDFKNNNPAQAREKLTKFIQSWVVFEGEVATRNPALYGQIESQMPLIMAKGDDMAQEKLSKIIVDLKAINPTANYSALDSMLILLREGLEALIIVLALVSALNASGQAWAKKWVYAGVAVGLLASLLGALALYTLFPVVASGENREILEGVVGIVAVVMMIGVGAWLHRKSSTKAWNAYIHHQLNKAMTLGSAVSLFLLAFLTVFREGAETILFYVGILPKIRLQDFLLGIAMALIVLGILAWLLIKSSLKLPIPTLFKVLTVTIYLLGFKILGVSILALQLTHCLSQTMISLPAIEWLGFYPSIEGMVAQLIYIVFIIALQIYAKKSLQNKNS